MGKGAGRYPITILDQGLMARKENKGFNILETHLKEPIKGVLGIGVVFGEAFIQNRGNSDLIYRSIANYRINIIHGKGLMKKNGALEYQRIV